MCEGRTVNIMVVMVCCGLLCESSRVGVMVGMVSWS